MLFLIQWLGGVYCAKKGGMSDDWVWIACIFVGWLFIIIYLIDNSKSSNNSVSTNSDTSSQTKQTAHTVPFKAPIPPQSQYSPPVPAISQKAPGQSNLPIEEEIFAYLKAQPVRWEYPLRSQDEALKNFCSALVFSEPVAAINNDENIRSLELTIQQKRAKNPQLADHNTAME